MSFRPQTSALLADALSEGPLPRRLRALASLEHTPEAERRGAAIALVPLLSAGPDVAARAHISIMALAPTLRLWRDEAGFVVAGDGDGDGDGGDGVALDELWRLFEPGAELPAFLQPPERPAPAPYRPPLAPEAAREAALARLVRARDTARAAYVTRLALLGLHEDDLDDDEPPPPPPKLRRPVRPMTPRFDVDDDDAAAGIVAGDVIVAAAVRPGIWWHDERGGDHRGARRFSAAVVADPSALQRVETKRVGVIAGGDVVVVVGGAAITLHVVARSAVVFIDVASGGGIDDHVVGVSITWTNLAAYKPGAKVDLRPPVRHRL